MVKKVNKNTKNAKKVSTSAYVEEYVMDAIDKWVAKKNEELGGSFSRNSFIRVAIIEKLRECGLLEDKA